MRRFIICTDVASVALALLLGAALLVRVVMRAGDLEPLAFIAGILIGYVMADVASGLVHWFCDTYFTPNTPLMGPMFIAAFREHHVDPAALGRHGVFERNGNNCLGSLPVLTLGLYAFGPNVTASLGLDVARGFLVAFAITVCFTNQIHAWAHRDHAPWLVRLLQRCGVLLTPEHHLVHHTGGQRNYAVVSGWSNRGLNFLLPRTERLLAVCGFRSSPDEVRL